MTVGLGAEKGPQTPNFGGDELGEFRGLGGLYFGLCEIDSGPPKIGG
jgi:hypothetical protein